MRYNLDFERAEKALNDAEKHMDDGKVTLELKEIDYRALISTVYEMRKILGDSGSDLAETIRGMLSENYTERFKAEYRQTKIRYEKLKAFNNEIEAAYATAGFPLRADKPLPVEMPEHDCPDHILQQQQRTMGEYLHILEVRAVVEGICLD